MDTEGKSKLTFSDRCVELTPRRGFALRHAIVKSQERSGTHLKRARRLHENEEWQKLDQLIVVTDEQVDDGSFPGVDIAVVCRERSAVQVRDRL